MNPLLEFEAEVGTTVIQTAIGLSGHPGLVGEIYKLPVHVPGMYRVTTVTDEIERRKKITLLAFGCTDATIGDKAAPYVAMTNESHGGVMMGEFEHLNWLHESMQLDDSDVWNQIADGLCTDKVLALSVGPNSERVDFAMVWGQDWFVPFPIFNDELICGYSILCDCTHEGVQRDRKPHRWEEIEARGELVGYVNRKDFVKCPHCDVSFKVTARSSWNGCRHLKCWGCIKLLRKEDIVE